jgi:hypothetical protein
LLEIPHFSRGREVNNYVKQLMAVLHGGFFWLEEPVSIDVELIAFITGLPSNGKNPTQYLDDKTKEKALAEDMKKTYGTERGSRGIIIKQISDATTKMTKKLMACKVLCKFHKEEVPTGVVAVATQCENDTMLSWAPYLLNLFLDECKDAQDLGTEFHYSWMMILITLIGWKEPPYSYLCDRVGCCRTTWYTSMGNTSDAKRRSGNSNTFDRYLSDIKDIIANTWRITLEVLMQYQGIANFKATRHNMWIQAHNDPEKEWLQL